MAELIDIDKDPVKSVLSQLLQDKTTGRNIIYSTDNYSEYGCYKEDEMTERAINSFGELDIQPRVLKDKAEQNERTRKKAEVFTPTWIVSKMNDHCDSVWKEGETPDDWKKYVELNILEITCGEAPFLVTRYDTTTGELLPISERTGMLDRKLKAIQADNEKTWLRWAYKAFESTYGYEFQGDNLLIARINLLVTFCDYLEERFQREATKSELKKIVDIIVWNIWQMDGLTDSVPLGRAANDNVQYSLFDMSSSETENKDICKIYDYRSKTPFPFCDMKEGKTNMKFDFVIGNPPYQEDVQNAGDRANPVYDKFMDSSNEIGIGVCLIHPARFLFNAGQTPKQWNRKMLHDPHFKVLDYQPDATCVFANTDIKGGIAITYHDSNKNYGEIGVFTSYKELNSIVKKVLSNVDESNRLNTIIASQGLYRFSDKLFKEHPEVEKLMGAGTGNKIVSSIIEKLPSVFIEKPDTDEQYVHFLGRINNQRDYRYIKRSYLMENEYIDTYNLFLPEANNSGHFGETLTEPTVGYPLDGSADTFLSGGTFNSETEPLNLLRYLKTKFFRALLGVKKVTQHCPPAVWSMIPLQDFTSNSDIDWSVSISEIDKQLYAKYGLTNEEINFIESHVKEME